MSIKSKIKIDRDMKKELYIAFATQKGGIGKTSVTVLVASYLHYVKGYNVAVIDCDYPQNSIMEIRTREENLIEHNDYFKVQAFNQIKKLGKAIYPIVDSNAVDALRDAERLIEDEVVKPDIVLFDLPGTIKSEGVLSTLSAMDYIFTPISADRLVVESSIQFVSMFNESLVTTGIAKTKGIHLFWTMVDKRERSELYETYDKIIEDMGLSTLKTLLPDSKRFRRDISEGKKSVFRSTIFPIDSASRKGSGISELVDEICEIIKT
ncbi:MAG: ParA family protein [Rikenellaceae bacterium]